jgi:TPR repeat protein
MMPAMMSRFFPLVLLLALMPCAVRAQFYDLDGAYRCLTAPDPQCDLDLRDRVGPPPPKPEAPGVDDVIAKVRDKTAGTREIGILENRAATKDPRAVEVLAWCRLNGIGGEPDVLAAYWLYREAAELGVANARRNQITIYETRLTPEQRHNVLTRENTH